MILCEKIQTVKSLKEKAEIVWEHYVSRKLNNELEPKWIHAAYETIRLFLDEEASREETQVAEEIISSHSLKDGYSVPAFPGRPDGLMRIIHDGWKAGTPTWVFMGRSFPEATIELENGWVAVKRSLPDEIYKMLDQTVPNTIWIAYKTDVDHQMGMSALTANCVGPAVAFEQLLSAISEE